MGNLLNSGTSKGDARGFYMESLLAICSLKLSRRGDGYGARAPAAPDPCRPNPHSHHL